MDDENRNGDQDTGQLLSNRAKKPSPDTLTKLIKRLRLLTFTLLPHEVDVESISNPVSKVITPNVVNAYLDAAGDFKAALPYCLLQARARFMSEANNNPADYDENLGRATACEVIARRIVHQSPTDQLDELMSARYSHIQMDGDASELSSALEVAIDSHSTIFISSSEAQSVVNSLWNGEVVQKHIGKSDIQYVPYHRTHGDDIWSHFDATRISVPRYQNFFRIIVWLAFLVVYSQAVREPIERLNPDPMPGDFWEYILYFLALAFWFEGMLDGYSYEPWYKLFRYATWRAFSFWNVIAFITDCLLAAAFILRVVGLNQQGEAANYYRLRSFQVLSFVAPFIWLLLTVFDGYKYVGTMQICVARMLQESGIFFALLSILALGFLQGLYALDAADGQIEDASVVIHVLVQALLQSPNYEKFAPSIAGLILYYFWNVVTALILLNVLISLFSSAYSDVVDHAEAEYLAFFASKTVAMIRAPDSFVYPAPFNLIEMFFIAPLEWLPISSKTYAKINRLVMTILFFIPLSVIALYECLTQRRSWMVDWLEVADDGDQLSDEAKDPQVDEVQEEGRTITQVPFDELVKKFPNTKESGEDSIRREIRALNERMTELLQKIDSMQTS
ncbi:hypothetical protein CONPUDRAFT_81817 [Coniophora puteana RWD-64-598 SS2]|uniref:Calcium activated cation channel n=1 Tax=Coniophora puteana (strain RWD-64-598) TaxID=741705 RepID=A0A5M3MT14_CONPW|nr:uncharacterized protein CONPUDRAFT_81817 [Coniophora puteana RWD-64-598 SS2]EIW82309.1 hypothetical protein CONPUDRAFT_81817 [Coniophora puteana RWD-64-598 SS2]